MEEQTTESIQQNRLSLREKFTTVTPLSKFIALALFVALPFIGFCLGFKYKALTTINTQQATQTAQDQEETVIPKKYASLDAEKEALLNGKDKYELSEFPTEWETFTNETIGISFEYPVEWGDVVETITTVPLSEENMAYGDEGVRKKYIIQFKDLLETSCNQPMGFCSMGRGNSKSFRPPRGVSVEDYSGDINKPKGVESKLMDGFGAYIVGAIEFNLPDKEISGIRLFIDYTTIEDGKALLSLGVKENSATTEARKQLGVDGTVTYYDFSDVAELLDTLELSEQSRIQMQIFERISQSAKVL